MSDDVCNTTGKHGYQTKTAATKAKAGVNRRIGRNGPLSSVYRCRACGLWHIGRER